MNRMLTDKKYNVFVGLLLLLGFVIIACSCFFLKDITPLWSLTKIIVLTVLCDILGLTMCYFSLSTQGKLIGYIINCFGDGILLSSCINEYSVSTITNAIVVTVLMTIIMIIVSMIYPKVFEKLGLILAVILVCVCCVMIVLMIIGVYPSFIDWIVCILICGYVGYDWHEAQKKEKTIQNAINSALNLYLDMVTIFASLLDIFKKD